MSGNQHGSHQARIAEVRQRGDPQHERQNERADAEGADPAVMHDLELALARRAAAEAVGDVGQPILMQTAGNDQRCRDRKHRCRQRRKVQRLREPIDARTDQADGYSDNGRSPQRLRQLAFGDRRSMRKRQARQEDKADLQIVDAPLHPEIVGHGLAPAR